MSFAATRMTGFAGQDFRVWWLGANAILHGRNPYTTIVFQHRPDFLYPLIAAIVTVPFAGIQDTIAGPLFITISCGLLAFMLTRNSWWPLLIFTSGGMFLSIIAAQFTPLLMLGFLSSNAMWLGALKPNIGLAMLAWRPSVKGAVLMALVTAISLISMPSWPIAWLRALEASTYHYEPVLAFGGPLILLALIRWRRPEARLLAVMALVPSSPIVYETLPLFLIARRRIELCLLAFMSSVAYLVMAGLPPNQLDLYMQRGRWVIVWLSYLPALAIVLARPNEAVRTGPVEPALHTAELRWWVCKECGSAASHLQQSCSTCYTRMGRETPRSTLAFGYAAAAIAYVIVIYVTFVQGRRA